MSNQELDNLFKNKLEELQKAPSKDAWQRVNAQLPARSNRSMWYYTGIAASILIVLGFVGIMWFNDNEEPSERSAQNTQTTEEMDTGKESLSKQPVAELIEDKVEHENEMIRKEEPREARLGTPEPLKEDLNKTELIAANIEETDYKQEGLENDEVPAHQEVKNEIEENAGEIVEEIIQQNATNRETQASTEQKIDQSGKTLIFDIEDFKKKTIAANTAETEVEKDKKERKIDKVFSAIKNIKESEKGLGSLRQAKNELFALNFKKENDGSK